MYALLLHNIRSLQNVGSLFRSADWAWWDRLYLTGYTGMPPRKEISKTALWAERTISWEYYEDPFLLVNQLKKQWFLIVSLELTAMSEDIFSFSHEHTFENICLILGSEREGVDPWLIKLSDHVLSLPMRGKKQSLNVSVAGALGMYLLSCKMGEYRVQ